MNLLKESFRKKGATFVMAKALVKAQDLVMLLMNVS